MVTRRPLVIVSGLVSELPSGDLALAGTSATEVVAGSGLSGGGFISSLPRLDVEVASNPSGLIVVEGALANDGVALADATLAAASGFEAASIASTALASGNAALSESTAALASGVAALELVAPQIDAGTRFTGVAATDIPEGVIVGLNDAGQIEPIRRNDFDYIKNPEAGPPCIYDPSAVGYQTLTYHPPTDQFLYVASHNSKPLSGLVKVTGNGGATFLPPQDVIDTNDWTYIDVAYSRDVDLFAVTYTRNNDSDIDLIPITITDNGAVHGTIYSFAAGTVTYKSIVHLRDNFFFVVWNEGATHVKASLAFGNSDSFGSGAEYRVFDGNLTYIQAVYDKQRDLVLVTGQDSNSRLVGFVVKINYTTGVLTVLGSQQLYDGPATYLESFYDNIRGRHVSTFRGNGSDGVILPYTITDNNLISVLGSGTMFEPTTYTLPATTYDEANDIFQVIYRGPGNFTTTKFLTPSGDYEFNVSNSGVIYADASLAEAAGAVHPPTAQSVYVYEQNSACYLQVTKPAFQGNNTLPRVGSYSNFIGIANDTVSSGSPVTVILPGDQYIADSGNYTIGDLLYLDCVNSGLRVESTLESSWSGQIPWAPVARATSPSGVLLINQL